MTHTGRLLIDDLSDFGQHKFLESKWVILQFLIEGSAIHQHNDHTIGYSATKHVIFLKLGGIPGKIERTNHAADHRVPGQLAVGFPFFFQGHAAQVRLDFEIVGCQRHVAFGGGFSPNNKNKPENQQMSGSGSVQMGMDVHDGARIAVKGFGCCLERSSFVVPPTDSDLVVISGRLSQHFFHIEIIHPAL